MVRRIIRIMVIITMEKNYSSNYGNSYSNHQNSDGNNCNKNSHKLGVPYWDPYCKRILLCGDSTRGPLYS